MTAHFRDVPLTDPWQAQVDPCCQQILPCYPFSMTQVSIAFSVSDSGKNPGSVQLPSRKVVLAGSVFECYSNHCVGGRPNFFQPKAGIVVLAAICYAPSHSSLILCPSNCNASKSPGKYVQ